MRVLDIIIYRQTFKLQLAIIPTIVILPISLQQLLEYSSYTRATAGPRDLRTVARQREMGNIIVCPLWKTITRGTFLNLSFLFFHGKPIYRHICIRIHAQANTAAIVGSTYIIHPCRLRGVQHNKLYTVTILCYILLFALEWICRARLLAFNAANTLLIVRYVRRDKTCHSRVDIILYTLQSYKFLRVTAVFKIITSHRFRVRSQHVYRRYIAVRRGW